MDGNEMALQSMVSLEERFWQGATEVVPSPSMFSLQQQQPQHGDLSIVWMLTGRMGLLVGCTE